MLAKQIWRVIQAPGSRVAQILKCKYFGHKNVVDAKLGHFYTAKLVLINWVDKRGVFIESRLG